LNLLQKNYDGKNKIGPTMTKIPPEVF